MEPDTKKPKSLLVFKGQKNVHYLDPDTGDRLLSLPYVENGTAYELYEDGKTTAVEIEYANGMRNGISKSFREDGTEEYETPYLNDEVHGVEKYYDEDGCVIVETIYEHNEIQECLVYYPDRKLRSRLPYVKGMAHGDQEFYDETGLLTHTVSWQEDKKHGKAIEYLQDDTSREMNFVNNVADGVMREVSADGKVLSEESDAVFKFYDYEDEAIYTAFKKKAGVPSKAQVTSMLGGGAIASSAFYVDKDFYHPCPEANVSEGIVASSQTYADNSVDISAKLSVRLDQPQDWRFKKPGSGKA